MTTVWAGLEVKACRFNLGHSWVAENTIFGTQQAVWKERLWGKSVLEKNIQTIDFSSIGSLRMLCVRNFIQYSKRKSSGTGFRLFIENYIDAESSFPLHVCSECIASSLRTISACELLHANFDVLFYIAHHKILFLCMHFKKYRMRPTPKWKVSLHEDLKNQLHSKKRTTSSQIGEYMVNLI